MENAPIDSVTGTNSLSILTKTKPGPAKRTRLVDVSGITFGDPKCKLTKQFTKSIADWLADGKTLKQWCDQPGYPARSTVYRWVEENTDLRDIVTRARRAQSHTWADECREIADDTSRDLFETTNNRGLPETRVNNAAPHRDKLRIETRMRLAGIYNPMYAPQSQNQIAIQVNTTVNAPRAESREEWTARQAKRTA